MNDDKTITLIFNKALRLIPHDVNVVSSTDESREATVCRDHFDDALSYCLEAHEWGWATQTTPFENACASHQHFDLSWVRHKATRIIGLFDMKGRRVKAKALNDVFFTDCPKGYVAFIPLEVDLEKAPHYFIDALVTELAYRISGVMSGSVQNENRLRGIAKERLERAIKIDASELNYAGTDGRTFARARQ